MGRYTNHPNPYARREQQMYDDYFRSPEDQYEDVDYTYDDPEYAKPRECSKCKGKAWYKASVGAWICIDCGEIQ